MDIIKKLFLKPTLCDVAAVAEQCTWLAARQITHTLRIYTHIYKTTCRCVKEDPYRGVTEYKPQRAWARLRRVYAAAWPGTFDGATGGRAPMEGDGGRGSAPWPCWLTLHRSQSRRKYNVVTKDTRALHIRRFCCCPSVATSRLALLAMS